MTDAMDPDIDDLDESERRALAHYRSLRTPANPDVALDNRILAAAGAARRKRSPSARWLLPAAAIITVTISAVFVLNRQPLQDLPLSDIPIDDMAQPASRLEPVARRTNVASQEAPQRSDQEMRTPAKEGADGPIAERADEARLATSGSDRGGPAKQSAFPETTVADREQTAKDEVQLAATRADSASVPDASSQSLSQHGALNANAAAASADAANEAPRPTAGLRPVAAQPPASDSAAAPAPKLAPNAAAPASLAAPDSLLRQYQRNDQAGDRDEQAEREAARPAAPKDARQKSVPADAADEAVEGELAKLRLLLAQGGSDAELQAAVDRFHERYPGYPLWDAFPELQQRLQNR